MSYTAGKPIPSFKYRYELMDTKISSNLSGQYGFSKANGKYEFNGFIGMTIGPYIRIKNISLNIANLSYKINPIIQYFPYHDLDITEQGIGRSGYNYLGNGWASDCCGFYFDISNEIKNNLQRIIFEYEFTGTINFMYNKHGLKFYTSTDQPSGIDGGVDNNFLGTWDNGFYPNLPNNFSTIKKTIINRISALFWPGTYKRRIVFTNFNF
jgi:hypothetical protein